MLSLIWNCFLLSGSSLPAILEDSWVPTASQEDLKSHGSMSTLPFFSPGNNPAPVTHIPQSQTTCMIIYLVFFFKPTLFLLKCLLWFTLRRSACIWSVDTPIHCFLIHIYINTAIKIDGSFATKIISWTFWGPWPTSQGPWITAKTYRVPGGRVRFRPVTMLRTQPSGSHL